MSAHYAMCKYDDFTGSYIPLEVRPTTDRLKKDDPLYQEGFQAGAASRDAEIAELQRKLANEQARDIHSCHPDCTREGCVNRRLRAELVKADGWREKYEDAKQQLVKAQWAIGAHTYWKARALDFEVERDIAVSTLEKVKADRTVAQNALAEQCKHTKTIEQQLAAEQAMNMRLREALINLMKYNPRTRYVGGVEFGYEEPVGECLLKALDRCDNALSTTSDDSALEAIVKKAGEVMRERCENAALENYDGWSAESIRALPAVTLEDLK